MDSQNQALQSLVQNIIPQDTSKLLASLRWREDMLVTNHEGERVWLKPLIIDGKRIGITDCCFENRPCQRHGAAH